MLIALFSSTPWDKILDGAAHVIDAAGKGTLAFVSFLVLLLAGLAFGFFGKEDRWVRIGAWLIIIACIFLFVLLLVVPSTKKGDMKVDQKGDAASNPAQENKSAMPLRQCAGEKTLTFTPKDPGVLPMVDGHPVDLGDGGGGTRLNEWKFSWKAPSKVISVQCGTGRNEHVIAQNRDGSNAECVGSINGGDDVMTMHVSWDGPCDQQ
jgi:hypothetical protein